MLTVITVNYGLNTDLSRTLESFPVNEITGVEHIIVASGLTADDTKKLIRKYSSHYRRFIINRDKSIYEAMNIGLKEAKGDFVLFLNGGDRLTDKVSLHLILSQLKSNTCHVFRTRQIWMKDIYIRPSLIDLKRLKKYPAHQGFIAPLHEETPLFNEKRIIDADTIWMKECIAIYGADVHSEVITDFYLGGISNFPTLNSVKKRIEGEGISSGSIELIKLLLRIFLGNTIYYRLLAIKSSYTYYRPKIKK